MRKLISLIISAMFLLTACSAQPQPSASSTPPETPGVSVSVSPSPSVTPPATPSETAPPSSAYPANVSFTTGLPLQGATFKPVAVMIENSPAARPQNGLQAADIVYEALAEGGITRFLCLFNDTMPKTVGPVRSLRLYYMQMQQEWDSILVHFGGPMTKKYESNVYGPSSEYIKIRVCGIKGILRNGKSAGSSADYFWRSKDRKAPHNAYTDLTKVQALYDYTPNQRTPWQFDAHTSYAPGEAVVSKVSLPFASNNSYLWYTYDKTKDVLIRHMGSSEFKDRDTKKAVEVKNLIVQYVKYRDLPEIKGRVMAAMTGGGEAEFIIGGKHFTGTWERKDLNSQTVFKDQNGKEIVLRPGNTWVAVHPDNKKIKVELEGAR